jgi:Zn-dependent peptidase ImmA (M78 family)
MTHKLLPDRNRKKTQASRERQTGAAYARALVAELPNKLAGAHEIAAALGLGLQEAEVDGFDGALVRATNLPLGEIVIRKSIREAPRKNFTIAHEIGHFVLSAGDRTSLACAASDVANWSDSSKDMERQADDFAAELLMPTALVQGIIHGKSPSLQLIEEIARKSRTSLSAAAWRYCDLAKESCAVVWSTDRVIYWSKRAPGFGFSLPKGRRIEEGTFADACFAKAKVPKQPRAVPARLWISPANIEKDGTIWEQSKALPAYRSAISLLWLKHEA